MGAAERELLLDAFDSNWIAPLGPHVDAFEGEMAARVGVAHAAALSSGTAALHLALQMLGVGPGDRVVVPTLTFVASAAPVVQLGATPVFVDSERRTWNMDPNALEVALTRHRPKAVVTVDLYGQCADYEAIVPLCARHGVPIIEDAAEAVGSSFTGKYAGSFGRLGVFSFNGNKIITTSGGGMLLSDDQNLINKARFLATQARDPAPHYEHSQLGYNYRMSNLLAAIGRGQLRVLDARIAAHQATRRVYAEGFASIEGIAMAPLDPRGSSNCWLTCVVIDPDAFGATREMVRLSLERQNIESRPVWKPMHLQPVFADAPTVGGEVAEDLFARGLCLPSGSSLTATERARVVEGVLACAR